MYLQYLCLKLLEKPWQDFGTDSKGGVRSEFKMGKLDQSQFMSVQSEFTRRGEVDLCKCFALRLTLEFVMLTSILEGADLLRDRESSSY